MKTTFVSYLVRLRKIKQHVTSDIFKWVRKLKYIQTYTFAIFFVFSCGKGINGTIIKHL